MTEDEYRQACIAAVPSDIRKLIQKAIERAFQVGRHIDSVEKTPYYEARDEALYRIGKPIYHRKLECKAQKNKK